MNKRKLIAGIAAVVSIVAFSTSYQSEKVSASTSSEPRFVEIDSSGLPSGKVFVDTKTDIEYVQTIIYAKSSVSSSGPNGVAVSFTMLYDKDGKPLIWKPEGEE